MTLTFALLVGLIPPGDGPPPARPSASPATVEVFTSTADVRDCALSDAGDVLAATGGGLVRLDADGRARGVLTRLDGLPGTQVDALSRRADGTVWVGTEGGLARVRLDDAAAGGLAIEQTIAGPAIVAIESDAAETETWVGTLDAGVRRVVGRRLEPIPYAEAATARSLRVHDLAHVDGVWFAATAQGLWSGDRTTGLSPWQDPVLGDDVMWSVRADGASLWVGGLSGLFRREAGRVTRVAEVDARDLAVGGADIEVAAMGEGIRRFAAGSLDRGLASKAGPIVHRLARVGTRRCVATADGLFVGDGSTESRVLADGLPSRDVSAMAWDADARQMWVGTFDGGVAVGDGTHWRTVAPSDIDPQVNAIALQRVAGRTVAWIGTARGLFRVDGEDVRSWSFKEGLPHHHVQALHVRANGDVLVGTTTGLVMIRDGEVVPDLYGKRPRRWAVWAIAEDADETLWIGTTQGLVRYPKDGEWDRLSMIDGVLPDNWITSVVVDGDELWVGTYAAGVAKLTIEARGVADPRHFGGGRINPAGLTLDGDLVYAATMGGLQRLRRGETRWVDLPDATPGHDVKRVEMAGTTMWVASRRGIRRR
jgi:ligand-binding sensor domain-containing protein